MHQLIQKQTLPIDPWEAWEFISRPENLNQITPPDLRFDILSTVPQVMYEGLLLLYEIRIPIVGKRKWVTEIKHIREGVSFVDEQRKGPYAFWYHYHEVKPDEAGTLMIDQV